MTTQERCTLAGGTVGAKKKEQQCHEVHEFHCRSFTIFREIQLPDEMSGINPHLLLQTRSHEGFKSCNLVYHRPLTVA